MSDRRRRWSPESSRRRRKDRRVSREQLAMEEAAAGDSRSMAPESSYSNTSYPYPSQAQSQVAASPFQQTALAADQHHLPPIALRSNDDIRTSMSTVAPMPMPGPVPGPSRDHKRQRDRRRRRQGSGSSSNVSFSSSGSSSYLEISRWYPDFGRAGGVLKTFFQTPSEHRPKVRRRRSGRKKKGIFGFGNNSSSSSVNSDMAYGMGFVKKPKGRHFSPRDERGASGRETSDGRPPRLQRRQTDEEIMDIGRKLAKVARDQNMEDQRAAGKRPAGQIFTAASLWDRFHMQSAGSSRGLPPSRRSQRHDTSSSDDAEWESASEDESSSDESSGLAYGSVEFDEPPPLPPKPLVSRQSTAASIRPPGRKSSAVDPKLFGPVNSLRGIVDTPCGFGDRNGGYPVPGRSELRRASTAESASIEARPLQTVFPVQTSNPEMVEAARPSGSVVPPQSSYLRDQNYPTGRTEPIIQAPKPIAPVPMRMYEEERIRDEEPFESQERRRFNPAASKTFVETALVRAGVAGTGILAGRERNEDKDREPEPDHHDSHGHDDHREDETKVEDPRRAQELALEKEIERLEKVLAERSNARERRKRDSKRDSGTEERRAPDAGADREERPRGRDSQRSEPDYDYNRNYREDQQPEASRRVSEPSEQPAGVDDVQTRNVENANLPSSSGIDVFRFQVPNDAFRTRDSPLRPSSPFIIDVTPAPSPDPDQMERKSRRDSFEEEMRNAKHIYDESTKSTAPISAVDMAAAIAATEQFHRLDEPERGRTNAKQRDAIQEEADRYYHARRMAEREVRSRSRSHSPEPSVVGKYGQDQGAEIPRIVTPPEMLQKPQKNMYSEPNADVKFDHLMSPEDHVFFRPRECPVRDPSAERPRPVLTLVIPTPVPTPSPESERERSAAKAAETVLSDAPDIVIGPRGEVIEVVTASPDSKRVSWGPSETKQYEVETPERSRERPIEFSETPKRSSKGGSWGDIAAAVAGAGAAAAILGDDEPGWSEHGELADDIENDTPLDTSRSSPPRDRKVLPKGMSSRLLDDEPEDAPPSPGPKPASPRGSQMPGTFEDDLNFAATLAAGLQDSGFDPNIVIDDDTYRRRDSPPGLNEPTAVYMQPFADTAPDLGIFGIDQGVPVREPGHVIGEVAETPASEKGPPLDDFESAFDPRRESEPRWDERHSTGHEDTEAVEKPVVESPKLSKKEQRKLEKAAMAAQLAEEEGRASQLVEAGDDIWEDAPDSKKSKRSSMKSKRSSVGWDDADTPVNDRRVSIPLDAFDEVEDVKASDDVWEEPKDSKRSTRASDGYDLPEEYPADRRERRREERRKSQFSEPLGRDTTAVMSETSHDYGSNVPGRDDEDSAVSTPDGKRDSKGDKRSSKEKRGSGSLWGLLKGSTGADVGRESKKGSAGTLGAGAGIAGAALGAAIAAGSLPSSSDAAEAPLEQEEPYVVVGVNHPAAQRAESVASEEHLLLEDPDIIPRVIKPAIDPQYGDLLPLPPSPGAVGSVDSYVDDDDLPALPDSRPATPPGQEKALLKERSESSQKRPAHGIHTRRRSIHETPIKSPSHTAIPIQFRMGPRTSVPPPPGIPRTPPTTHTSPAAPSQETFPSTKKQSRPTSWDRPMSWDTSKEIRPLYLLERSRGGEQEHDDTPETTPLPPSSESSAPESEHDEEFEASPESEHDEDFEASPLVIDTAAAQAAPLGSEESTPKGVGGTDFESPASAKEFEFISPDTLGSGQPDYGLHNWGKEPETTPLENESRSSLVESSYATPFESPRGSPETRPLVEHRESTESTPDFRDALDAPADDEDTDTGSPKRSTKGKKKASQAPEHEHAEEPEQKGYFPSVLSMLPTLVGVDALLGRGKRDELPIDVDVHTNERQAQELPSEGPDEMAERGDVHTNERQAQELPSEAPDEMAEKGDVHTNETQAQELPSEAPDEMAERGLLPRAEVEMVSPVGSGDQGQSPTAASPRKSPIDTPHSTISAGDASLPNDTPAVHMHPEPSPSIDDMRATESVVRDVSDGILEIPAQDSPVVVETPEVLSPSLSSHATIEDPLTTSPANETEDMEPIPETPTDTVDWVAGSGPTRKLSVSDDSHVPVTAESSAVPLGDAQRVIPIQNEPSLEAVEDSTSGIGPIAASPTLHKSDEPFQEGLGAEPSTSFGAKGKELEESPIDLPQESVSNDLIHEPEAMPFALELPTSPGTHSPHQSQNESQQAGGRQMKSAAASRRLRSSRVSMSPSNSMDEYMSSDAAHSGEDVPTSPRSTTSSGLRSAGRNYKKTRSLRSSRRSSMASSQGSSHENEAAPIEEKTEQPVDIVTEHTKAEVVEGAADRQLDVEKLEPTVPAESAAVEDSGPRQREDAEEPMPSQPEIVEEHIPSQHENSEEPVFGQQESVEEPSISHPEVDVEQPSSAEADFVEEPSSTQPEILEVPVSGQSGTLSEPQDSPETPIREVQDEDLSQTPSQIKNQGLAEGPDGSPAPETFADKEMGDLQELSLPETPTPEVHEAIEEASQTKDDGLAEGPDGSPAPETFADKEMGDLQELSLPEILTPEVHEAIEKASEAPAEELVQEQRSRELAEATLQPSEPDRILQDDSQQQIEFVPSTDPEEQAVESSSDMKVEEPTRDVAHDESPVRPIEQMSELAELTTQPHSVEGVPTTTREDLSEVQPQELESAPVLVKEENPVSPEEAKDNTVIDEPVQSTGAATPAESDPVLQVTGAPAEPMQEELQLEQLPSESQDAPLDQGMQLPVTDVTGAQEAINFLEPEAVVEASSEPIEPMQALKPVASIDDGNVFAVSTMEPETLPSSMEPEDSISRAEGQPEEALDDDEVARRVAEAALIQKEEAELARLQQKKKRKSKDNKRISVLVANAERRAEKADETTAPPPSSQAEGLGQDITEGDVVKSELEEAIPGDHPEEGNPPLAEEPILAEQSASTDRDTVVPELEQLLTQPEVTSHAEDAIPESKAVLDSGVVVPVSDQVIPPADDAIPESKAVLESGEVISPLDQGIPPAEDAFPESKAVLESGEVVPPLDHVIPPAELQPEPVEFESPVQLAHREAEVALIQEEEAELDRLAKKKKPSKKDKGRIKALKANAARRAQEFEVSKDVEANDSYPTEGGHGPEEAESQLVQDTGNVPRSQVEETIPDLQADSGHAEDSSRTQVEEATQPQTEEVSPSQAKIPSLHTDNPVDQPRDENTTQEPTQDQPGVSREITDITKSQLDNSSQATFEPLSTAETSQEQEKDNLASPTVASFEPATPLTVAEPSVVQPRELSEVTPLSAEDSGAAPVPILSEITSMEQGQASVMPIQEDNVSENISADEDAIVLPTKSRATESPDQTSSKLERSSLSPAPFEEGTIPVTVPEPTQNPQSTEPGSPLATKESGTDQIQERKGKIFEEAPQSSGTTTPVTLDDVKQEITSIGPVDDSQVVKSIEDRPALLEVTSQPETTSRPAQEPPSTSISPEAESAQKEDTVILRTKETEKSEASHKETLSGTMTPMETVGEVSSPAEPEEVQASELVSTEGFDKESPQTSELDRLPSREQEVEASGSLNPNNFLATTTESETEGSSTTFPVIPEPEQIVVESDQTSPSVRKSDGWGFLASGIAGIGAAIGLSGEDDRFSQGDEHIKAVTAEQNSIRGVDTGEGSPSRILESADVVKNEEEPLENIGRDQPRDQTSTDVITAEPETISQEPDLTQDDPFGPEVTRSENSEKKKYSASSDLDPMIVDSSGSQPLLYDDLKQDEYVTGQASEDANIASQQFDTASEELRSSESELQDDSSVRTVPVTEREIDNQSRLEESSQIQTAQEAPANNTIPKPELEGKADEGADTLIVAGSRIPEGSSESTAVQQDWPTNAEQAKELAGADNDQPYLEPGSLTPAEDKIITEAFATPMEQPQILPSNPEPMHTRTGGGQTEDDIFDIAERPSSISPRQSHEIEPEIPTSLPETPLFEETLEKQPVMELVDTKEVAEGVIEPAIEGLNKPDPKEMSKEKWKAEQVSVSVSEPEVTTAEAEDLSPRAMEELAQPQTISGHQDQTPVDLSTSSGTHQVDPSQQRLSREKKPSGEVAKVIQQQDPERSLDVQDLPSQLPEPSTRGSPEEPAAGVTKSEDAQPSSHQPMESYFPELQGTVAEDMPVLSRILSEKEKRKAASALENDVLEPSQPQTPLTEELQPRDVPATPSPVIESDPAQTGTSIDSQPAQGVTESTETTVTGEVVAEDEWATPLSLEQSKKDKKEKGKQPALEPTSEPQTPLTEQVPVHRAAETNQQVPGTQETVEHAPEDTGESTINHRSAEVYVPVAEEMLERTTDDYGETMRHVAHRSAEVYVPEAQEPIGGSTGRSGHHSADVYVPGTQETFGQITEDAGGPISRGHRSAELYVPVAQATLEQFAEDSSMPTSRTEHRPAETCVPEAEAGAKEEGAATFKDPWEIPTYESKNQIKRKSSLVVGNSKPTMPMEDETSGFPDGEQVGSQSPDIEGRELQRRESSPDIWNNDDYFQPRPDDLDVSPRQTFNSVEINPAVARELNTSTEKPIRYDRPLVGLGLIHRHSSIFRESDGHTPRLLTMTSENDSTDSLAILDDPSEPDTSTAMDNMPVPEASNPSHEEPTAPVRKPYVVTGKDFGFAEPDPYQLTNAPPAQRFIAPNLKDRQREATASTRPSPDAPQQTSSPFDVKDPAKKGGVAALAEKFGGIKKAQGETTQIPRKVNQLSPREADNFDEPAMWEETQRNPFEGSRLDVDSDNFWAVPDTQLEDEQLDPDVHPGQGASTTSHGRETQIGDDNVSETRSHQSDSDARKFTPQIPEPANPKAEVHVEEPVVVESPIPSQQPTVELPRNEAHVSVEPPVEPPDLDIGQEAGLHARTTDTSFNESRGIPHSSPSPRFPSPVSEKGVSLGEPIVASIKTTDGDTLLARPSSAFSLSRSLSAGLPPVQEEPQEEESEAGKHGYPFSPGSVTPDINRDSGFVTDSPILPRVRQSDMNHQHRDSGVHMRDSPGTSPKLLGLRDFSPQPGQLSKSYFADEGGELQDKPSKQPSPAGSDMQRLLREPTPILEAQEPPVTPEPQKSRSTSPKKYPDLGPSPGKAPAVSTVAGGAALITGARETLKSPAPSQRSVSDKTDRQRATPEPQRRVGSNTANFRTRTPERLNLRSESPSLFRHSGTPPLRSRRTRSGDLRSLGQSSNRSHSHSDLDLDSRASPAASVSPASAAANTPAHATYRPTTPSRSPTSSDLRRATTPAAAAAAPAQTNSTPVANEGRVRAKDMADVYDGFGEGRLGSPRSPTRPHSMRRRQSMQVLELESRVDQLIAENRALQEARAQAQFQNTSQATSTLADRDTEIEALKQNLEFMRKEIQRLAEVNEGLNSAIQQTAVQYDDRYRLLESQHADATRELHEHRSQQGNYDQANHIIEEKDAEIRSLREQLEATKEHIREIQAQILAAKSADSEFLRIKDVDYFDHRCQQLCSHVQQWVLRFSKFSDMRACRLTNELNDEKIIDRLDNAVLDGSNVDHYLNDRVRRRDIFMSLTMTMIWEFVFTRYLFGMDREQRQKLKALEKLLLEVGPPQAVRQWRAVTLTLLSRREQFRDQRYQDTEAVVQAIFQTLCMILPPPSHLEDQIQNQLRRVMREAVDLSIEMRTQRAEYMMLPPMQPDYDANGDLAEPHPFNAALMNERSPESNRTADDLEAEAAIVRVVLFPLVVKKGDDEGLGDDEIVVCPAQVIVSRPRSKSRQSYKSDAGGVSFIGHGGSPSTGRSRSNVSMKDVEGMEGAI